MQISISGAVIQDSENFYRVVCSEIPEWSSCGATYQEAWESFFNQMPDRVNAMSVTDPTAEEMELLDEALEVLERHASIEHETPGDVGEIGATVEHSRPSELREIPFPRGFRFDSWEPSVVPELVKLEA